MNVKTIREGFVGQKMIALPKSTINFIKKSAVTQNFYLSHLGYYPSAKLHYRKRKHGASQYILIYCIIGKGEIQIDGVKSMLYPNQFAIIPKKVKHEYKADIDDPWSIYWFHFNGKLADNFYNRYKENQNPNYRNIAFSEERMQFFEKIYSFFDRNLQKHIEYANLLALSFISNFIYNDFENDVDNKFDDTVVNAVVEFLIENLNKKLTLDEVASKFNYSKSYLHTKFKSKTGYPVLVYFNLKKIQRACEFLNYSDRSIKEISFALGFDNPLYFSRIFKNFMGKSPKHYRQS